MRAPDTDETVTCHRGTRLSVNNFAGEVIVRGWDRDAVRVQARHSSAHARRDPAERTRSSR